MSSDEFGILFLAAVCLGPFVLVCFFALNENRNKGKWETVKDDGRYSYQQHKVTGKRRLWVSKVGLLPVNQDWVDGKTDIL
jgi:hypothetical protein